MHSGSNWIEVDGGLERTFELPSFPEAIAFVNRVAELAEQENHQAASSAASRRRLAARGRVLGRPDSWTIGAPCVLATNAEPLAG